MSVKQRVDSYAREVSGIFASVLVCGWVVAACSTDEPAGSGGPAESGGASGTGGKASGGSGGRASGGSGGKASGGSGGKASGGSGGKASGGAGGTGGKASGGAGGADGGDGSAGDGGDAGCGPGQVLRYMSPGCDGTVQPVCSSAGYDAGLIYIACLCDGRTIPDGGVFTVPFRHGGPCTDGGHSDASHD